MQDTVAPSARPLFLNITVFAAILTFVGTFAYAVGSSLSETSKMMLSAMALVMLFLLPILIFAIGAIVRTTRQQVEHSLKQTQVRVVDDLDEPRLRRPQPPALQSVDDDLLYPLAPRFQAYKPPAPREVFLPRNFVGGQAMPYGYQPAPRLAEVSTLDADGQRISIDERILSRFLSCKTPSRAEWSGAKQGYTQAAALCVEQGLCQRLPNGGLQWVGEFANEPTRLAWAQTILT